MPLTSNGVRRQHSLSNGQTSEGPRKALFSRYSLDMPGVEPASPELLEDSVWKRIQQNTFTRWCNEQLKCVNVKFGSLENDLSDGLVLIRLVEVLSGKHLPNHNKKPNFRSQKLENVSIALGFLENTEGIRLVNIDSSDIVDQRLKLILGLIWTLILHYSISMPVWDDELEGENSAQGAENGAKAPAPPKETPKQRLMGWIRAKVPQVDVNNFTSNWNDGIALGALVDAVAPGLNPDWPQWKSEDALANTTEAMDLAHDCLGVAKLIEPEEMTNPKVDELSVMTYLAQYPNAKLRPDAVQARRASAQTLTAPPPAREELIGRAYGKGIKSGIEVGVDTEFFVEVIGQANGNELDVSVKGPTGLTEAVDVLWSSSNSTYTVDYTPRAEGPYKIIVKLSDNHVDGSPFLVKAVAAPVDHSKVQVAGPGLEPGVLAGSLTYFDVFTKDAGRGKLDVGILCPDGKGTLTPKYWEIEEGVHRYEYTPLTAGLHSVNIFFERKQIAGSPYGVHVKQATEPSAVRAWGRGLQPKGVRVGDVVDVFVTTEGAGDGKLDLRIQSPEGRAVPLQNRKQLPESTVSFDYAPVQVGQYTVFVSFDGQDVSQSPYEVTVLPRTDLRVYAYGPGLESGLTNLPCDFTVETNGEVGALGFSIEGPSQAEITCNDNNDGSVGISYKPTEAGEYAVHILSNEEDIRGSPFMANIYPYREGIRPSMVSCYGPGIDRTQPLKRGARADFTVDCHSAGKAALKIWALDNEYNPVDVTVIDNADGTYQCSYTPQLALRHTVVVSYGGVAVPGSPFRVEVEEPINPAKVKLYGPGVESGVKSLQPTHFVIDCKQAGPGEVEVRLCDERDTALDIDVLDNHDGSFTVKYTAPRPGRYNLCVEFAGVQIPGTPIKINVQPHLNVGGIRVEGLENLIFVDCPAEFVVDASPVSLMGGPNKVQVYVMAPNMDTPAPAVVVDNKDGTYTSAFVPPEEGVYHVTVSYEQIPVPQSPITVMARSGSDVTRCKASGSGLERGYVGMKAQFRVQTKGAGQGGLSIKIEGPAETKIECHDNRDGSCTAEYVPYERGDYVINIRFADSHIPGSPFCVPIDFPVDASRVKAWGPGLEPEHCRTGVPLKFFVDTSESGYAPLNVAVRTDKGSDVPSLPEIREHPHNRFDVTYFAPEEGTWCLIHVTFGGDEIAKSPFRLRVLPRVEPEKVRVTGQSVVPLGKVPASIPVQFTVDTRLAGDSDLEVLVVDPSQEPCAVSVLDRDDGTYDVTFIPEDVGPYNIIVNYDGRQTAPEPYKVNAYAIGDASKCWIMEKPDAIVVGRNAAITVNAVDAGQGLVTCRVVSEFSPLRADVDVNNNKNGTYTCSFTPPQVEPYKVILKFGGQPVPKGEFTFSPLSEEEFSRGPIPIPADSLPPPKFWKFQLPDTQLGELEAAVIMPSKKVDLPSIAENADGSVTVKYQPHEVGLHEMQLKYNGVHVQGSPFQFHVDAITGGYLTAFGPGLVYGTAGEPAAFTVCAKEASGGGLSVAIEGPAKADIKCHDNKDGTCSVSWVPPASGEYKIHVRFADKDIKGSPYTARVAGEGRKRAHISVGSTSEIALKISEPELRGLSASIKSPSGIEEPCFIRKIDDHNLGVSFTPREAGEHLVSVKKNQTLLPQAPFRIKVGQDEVGNADKVKITGLGLSEAETQKFNDFVVDTRDAGFGGLSVSLEGPSRAEIKCLDNKDGTCKISYKPTEPGVYILGVKFADHHVPSSPFTVRCIGQGVGTVVEKLTKQRPKATVVGPGSNCEFYIKLPFMNPMDLHAKIMNPEGKSEDAEMRDIGDHIYCIKFKPAVEGLHTVSVLHKSQHVSGSPFQFTVGPFKEGGAHKVRAGGPGLVQGEVNTANEFNVFTREAGAGNLSVAIEGPGKPKMELKDQKDGNGYIVYKAPAAGEYTVAIKWDDKHVPDSPFKVQIAPSSGEARKLEVASFPDMGLQLNKPVTFTVLTNGGNGHLDAKFTAPSGTQDDCFIVPIDEGESYAVRFIPKESGNHYVAITLDGTHMRDSPFRVRVGGKDESDPTAVTASGDGLKHGETGQKLEYFVDTCNAGAGNLNITVDGPSKVTLDAYEVDIGYKVRYTPMAPGDYYMTIKYNGVHVPGSPFKVVVKGKTLGGSGYNESSTVKIQTVAKVGKGGMEQAPTFKGDASKCDCKGMGLKRAYPGRLNVFNVDCSKAGQDMLLVAVMTPKGPADEIHVKHQGRGMYVVNYKFNVKGTTYIYIFYGEEQVPGSPFAITI